MLLMLDIRSKNAILQIFHISNELPGILYFWFRVLRIHIPFINRVGNFFHPERTILQNLQSIPFALGFVLLEELFLSFSELNRSFRFFDCLDSAIPREDAFRFSRPDFRPGFSFRADFTGVCFVLAIIDSFTDLLLQ